MREINMDKNIVNGVLSPAGIRTYSAYGRKNLVTTESLLNPGEHRAPEWGGAEFDELCSRIATARRNNRPVILSMGAHVIKCGLSRYLIALMEHGAITHIAGNGACSIHDFELAYLGGTSEHVPSAIEDGSFGMWEETGSWMNAAIARGAREGLGYGEALAEYIRSSPPDRFPHRTDCVLYRARELGVPATYHVALGTDIIHQHPLADFSAIGATSGLDFYKFCASVAALEGGVYLNFGSSVIGPEVFLKALSMSRNLGYQTYNITTANFDIVDLGDYRRDIGYDDPDYYYRPRKNIVNRPPARGGMGWHFTGDHRLTIPGLYERLSKLMGFCKEVPE